MSEEVSRSTADALAENAALRTQLAQAHAATQLAQADAEALRAALRELWRNKRIITMPLLFSQDLDIDALLGLTRTAHPGTPLADEVAAARAANHIMYKALGQIDKHDVNARINEEAHGAHVRFCAYCVDMREIASEALAALKAGAR